MHREELRAYLDNFLEAARFRDYCPNGLQVEGRAKVRQIVCGVTASQALLDEAVRRRADTVLVHHGWFWKNNDSRIIGIRRRRLATLLGADINLFAYHLPLDAHPGLGNNAELARYAGWRVDGRFGEQDLGFTGALPVPASAAQIGAHLETLLGRTVLIAGDGTRQITRLAWCSGAAQGMFEQAIQTGADCFVSGEISEQTVHLARESGVPYIAAGHHATERYGIMALATHIGDKLSLDCQFVDIDNPV
jgi:dinuclear metal center YbgI/SA1388 family protein